MRVICKECGEKAVIRKTNTISVEYVDLYCACTDPECGHTFVSNLSYARPLSPSAKTTSDVVMSLFKALPPEQRQAIQQELALV
ncbi:MAG: ogr/Delta-like zinc finger family protein [Parashewanella sp.]